MSARKKQWIRRGCLCVLFLFVFQTASCGYIMYPERRGQTSGKIDAGVAVMDGIGLLLFLVPGIVAFAVDFSTGAIYLPGGKKHAQENSLDKDSVRVVQVDPKKLDKQTLERIVYQETGARVDLDASGVKALEVTGASQAKAFVSEINAKNFAG